MINNYNLRITFFLRKGRVNSNNECPIYVRVYVNEQVQKFSTNSWINPERWNNTGFVKGNKEDAASINNYLTTVKNNLFTIYNELLVKKEIITPSLIIDRFFGRNTGQKMLLETIRYHNQHVESLVGHQYAVSTMKRYKTSLNLIEQFLEEVYKKKDMYLIELKYQFIADYEHFLKVTRKNSHNTAVKYIRNFRKVIKLAVRHEWLEKDPFAKYENPLKEVKRDFLTRDELKLIEEKEFVTERLTLVRDIFVFCCYTGLAYVDVANLTPELISNGIDGELWLFTSRQKTGTDSHVPLLPKAVELIDKYKNHPQVKKNGKVFPVKSNQKMNAYLAEIADLCGVKKKLTMHIARHTFGTLMLTLGVSIESVSSMLGHKNIKTTQHYSKIVKEKVSNDMKELKKKLKSG